MNCKHSSPSIALSSLLSCWSATAAPTSTSAQTAAIDFKARRSALLPISYVSPGVESPRARRRRAIAHARILPN